MKEYTRDELIMLCEKATVKESDWRDRDSESAQRQIGEALMLLRAGCAFTTLYEKHLYSDERTVWIRIVSQGFEWHEGGKANEEVFYIPTLQRIEARAGKDWY